MNLKIALRKEKIYEFSLIMFLTWAGLINGVKWKSYLLPLMNSINSFVMYGIVILLLYCILLKDKVTKRMFLLFSLMVATSVIIYLQNNDNSLLFLTLFILGSYHMDFEKIAKRFAIGQLVVVVGILIVYNLGLSEDVVSYFSYGTGHSLGTYHANNLGTIGFSCYLALCYCYIRNNIKVQIVLAIVAVLLLWQITLSRTNCLLILLFPITQIIVIMMKKTGSTRILKLSKYLLIGLFLITVFMTILYENITTLFSDGTFLERFRFGSILLQRYGIHLFGSKIDFVSTVDARILGVSNLVLDNAYLKLIISYGVIPTIFIIAIFSKVIRSSLIRRNYNLLIISVLIAISGLTQGMFVSVYNFVLLTAYANMDSGNVAKKG